MEKEIKMNLYICNHANSEHCKKVTKLSCSHIKPHERYEAWPSEEKFCGEVLCMNDDEQSIKVKCIGYKENDKCVFTHNIADQLECDPEGNFDDNGFPIKQCEKFPCEKFKNLIKEIEKIKGEINHV